MKKRIKLGACKGKLLPILEKYLKSIDIDIAIPSESRKVYYEFEKENYILEVYVLRYDDLIRFQEQFDLLLYGTDQVLEKETDCHMVLKYFEQENCRLSVLKSNSSFKENIDFIATNYMNSASKLLGISKSSIIKLGGALEVAPYLGLSDFILDIIVTGNSAIENNLSEYKELLKVGAVLATNKIELIDEFRKIGLIVEEGKIISMAVDGIDGSGKSLISNLLLNSKINENPNLLLEPFHSDYALQAFELWEKKDYIGWASMIGRCSIYKKQMNLIYDRSIITCLTDLLNGKYSYSEIINVIKKWNMPDVIFYLDIPLDLAIQRNQMKNSFDQFDCEEQVKKYYDLYKKAATFLVQNHLADVVYVDGTKSVNSEVDFIKRELKKRL